MTRLLAIRRTLIGIGVDLVCLPLHILRASARDLWDFFSRWRKYAFEYEEEFKERSRRAEAERNQADSMPAQPSTRPQGKLPMQNPAPLLQTDPVWIYMHTSGHVIILFRSHYTCRSKASCSPSS